MKKFFLLLIIGIAIIILITAYKKNAYFLTKKTPNVPSQFIVLIDNYKIEVELADTPEKQAQGLSGITELKEGTGMLFPYNPPEMVSFWMKDMLIPIDIIFIKDNQIVTLYEKVQPEPGVSLNQLKRYSPNQPIDYVLEVPAGWSEKNGISVGSSANYIPTPAQSRL